MKKLMMILGTATIMLGMVHAQNLDTLKVKLPYTTIVSGKQLPAGEYTIQVLENADAVPILEITSTTGTDVMAPAYYLDSSENPKDDSHVVLIRHGDHYGIDKVWIGDIGYQLANPE
jgi:hypothetical protein